MNVRKLRLPALFLVVAPALLGPGCVEEQMIANGNPFGAFMNILLHLGRRAAKATGGPRSAVKGDLEVPLSGSIGGLSGTFSLTFGTHGTFGGTGTIGKDRKSATVKSGDTPELRALVDALVLEGTSTEIDVTSASAKFAGRQTTGGVKKSWKGAITFAGVVAAGPDAGRTVRGKIKSKGSY